jgi:hypothetical protein
MNATQIGLGCFGAHFWQRFKGQKGIGIGSSAFFSQRFCSFLFPLEKNAKKYRFWFPINDGLTFLREGGSAEIKGVQAGTVRGTA